MTTGGNDFFTVDKNTIDKFKLKRYAKPLLGRSVQVKGCNFTREDWLNNQINQSKANLLLFPSKQKIKKQKVIGIFKYR